MMTYAARRAIDLGRSVARLHLSNVKFWRDLPTFFGLPEWETLTRDELDM